MQIRSGNRNFIDSRVLERFLSYHPPFEWQAHFTFLSMHRVAGVDNCAEGSYQRSVRIGENVGWIEVTPDEVRNNVSVRLAPSLSEVVLPVLSKVRRQFDLDADPLVIAAHLGELSLAHPGLRVPGAFDGFEMAVRIILGQQVSIKGAITLMRRFVTAYGDACETQFDEIKWLFPTATKLAAMEPLEVSRVVNIPRTRGLAIVELARAIVSRKISLDEVIDMEETLKELRKLPGIGEWTAQYIAMTALNDPDAFPHSDLAICKALKERNPKLVLAAAEVWRPWRAYAAVHLWKSLDRR